MPKTIAGHELMPGKTVKDHNHVEGTELHVPRVLHYQCSSPNIIEKGLMVNCDGQTDDP